MRRLTTPLLVRRALIRHAFVGLADAELIRRFALQNDADAFSELVERYAPMVWGTCRRICRDEHRAEDAFQSTFIALARQANSFRRAECLPGWLYRVARRTAQRLRPSEYWEPAPIDAAVPSAAPSPLDRASANELMSAIEAELALLPEKYRSAVLLCWFDDSSLNEAAKQLGTTKGVLWGRLKRAREKLRQRLNARGFGLPAVIGAFGIANAPASAKLIARAIDAALVPTTTATVGLAATGILGLGKVFSGLAFATVLAVGIAASMVSVNSEDKPAKEPTKDLPKTDAKLELAEAPKDGFPLPAGAIHRFGNRQMRHPHNVLASSASPDGKLLATVSHYSLLVWDLKTLSLKRSLPNVKYFFPGRADTGLHFTFLSDSKSVAVATFPDDLKDGIQKPGAERNRVQVWDVETGNLKYCFDPPNWNYELAIWATDKREIAMLNRTDNNERQITYHDERDGKFLRKVQANPSHLINCVSADGTSMASSDERNSKWFVSDPRTGKELLSCPFDKSYVATLSRDGKRFANLENGTIWIHDLGDKKDGISFSPHVKKEELFHLTFSSDNQTLFFGGKEGTIHRWNLKDNRPLADFGKASMWGLNRLDLSADGSILYSMADDKVVRRWDLKVNRELPSPEGYYGKVVFEMLPNGRQMIVADQSGQIDLWNLKTGKKEFQFNLPDSKGIEKVAVSSEWTMAGVYGFVGADSLVRSQDSKARSRHTLDDQGIEHKRPQFGI